MCMLFGSMDVCVHFDYIIDLVVLKTRDLDDVGKWVYYVKIFM